MENKTPRTGVYVVYCSDKTPGEIREYLTKLKTEKSSVGPVRMEYYGIKETNRNICVMSDDIFKAMIDRGHSTQSRKDGLSVSRYHLTNKDYPRNNGVPLEIFIKLPLEIFVKLPETTSLSLCRKILEEKLKILQDVRLLMSDFKIDIPYKSRALGSHYGKAIISFGENSKRPEIALVKVSITNSFWGKKVDPKGRYRIFTNWNKFPVGKSKSDFNVNRSKNYKNIKEESESGNSDSEVDKNVKEESKSGNSDSEVDKNVKEESKSGNSDSEVDKNLEEESKSGNSDSEVDKNLKEESKSGKKDYLVKTFDDSDDK